LSLELITLFLEGASKDRPANEDWTIGLLPLGGARRGNREGPAENKAN